MDDFCIEVKSQNEYGVMFHKQWNTEKTDQVTGDKNVKFFILIPSRFSNKQDKKSSRSGVNSEFLFGTLTCLDLLTH